MFQILITEKFSEQGKAILEAESDFKVTVSVGLSEADLLKIIGEFDALIVRSETKVNAAVIKQGARLKIVGRAGVGVDNVDVAAASHAGIIVMNTPDGNTISAAEHTMAMLLALARNIPQAYSSMKSGKWERSKFMGVELFGKQLGVIGLGRIGGEVAKRAAAFGMRIVGYDPFASEMRAEELGAELVDLDELLKTSDFITVHTPKTNETAHLIGKKELELTKKGVRLVNVARGGLYDEVALAEAIVSGKVAGVATDVYEKEPPSPESPLLQLSQVVFTPHLGASTSEAQENVAISLAHQVVDALKGRVIANAVNIPSVGPEEWENLRPYAILADRLGAFLAQNAGGELTSLHFIYSGEVAHRKTGSLTLTALAAALRPRVGAKVNLVNAMLKAKEVGTVVTESVTTSITAYATLIRIEATTAAGSYSIAGTLDASNEPRIVEVDGYRVDTEPTGNFVIFLNQDVPGILGKVATLLGDSGVNIAGLSNGRRDLGGDAVTIIRTDQVLPEATLKKLSELKALHKVREIRI